MVGAGGSSVVSGVKYFVSQSRASLVFIILILLDLRFRLSNILILGALFFKLGIPPFHRWIVRVINRRGAIELYLIFTVQKFIPLIIISQLIVSRWNLMALVLSRIVLILVNLNSIRIVFYLMFISSVRNSLWVVSAVAYGGSWAIYIIIYSFMLGSLIIIIKLLRFYKLSDINNSPSFISLILAFQFFNLGGVPPLTGFLLKLIILKQIYYHRLILTFMLIIISLCLLYIYIAIFFTLYCVRPVVKLREKNIKSIKPLLLLRLITLGARLFIWLII